MQLWIEYCWRKEVNEYKRKQILKLLWSKFYAYK
jgi:hypothetical protein